MAVTAITILKERGGSSLQAIKKHIASKHMVDMDCLTPFIRKFLKSAVAARTLVYTSGKGANGSFKFSASGQKQKNPKKVVKKGSDSCQESKTPVKNATKPKSKLEKKKPAAAKKAAVGKNSERAKSPKKVKATKPEKLKTPKKLLPKKQLKNKW
ncbi:histone H1, orphon [Caerostris extrusa]|uniref:Histone H1, orphon n=1 Tax=Caerostris extrusa TaxID=172846 RepID=A0AAV4U0A1_CAEEX|nr:histone H1, orphon [Caerostris extrusa]